MNELLSAIEKLTMSEVNPGMKKKVSIIAWIYFTVLTDFNNILTEMFLIVSCTFQNGKASSIIFSLALLMRKDVHALLQK